MNGNYVLMTYRCEVTPLTNCTTLFGDYIVKETTHVITLYFIVYFDKQHVTTLKCLIPL